MVSETWQKHISNTLSNQGIVAYIWNIDKDSYEWQGNLGALLGSDFGSNPKNSLQMNSLINPQDVPGRLAAIHAMNIEDSLASTYRIKRANGMQIDVRESGTMHKDGTSGDRLICGIIQADDKAQFASSAAKAQDLNNPFSYASYDTSMTHYGRLMICQKVSQWREEHAVSTNAAGYLMAIGIDRLSMFNEAFGASFADEVIEQTGARLRKMVGDNGIVARIDGDVFAAFLGNAPHAEMAAVAHQMLRSFYDVPINTRRGPLGVGISIGGVLVNRACKNPADMMTKAEMALQTAKERGRGRYIAYNEMAGEAENTRQILESGNQFMNALKSNRVRLAFQPVVNSRTNEVSFHESLIRFYDESGKIHTAGDFVVAVEKLGLSCLLDRFAMRMALEELAMFPELHLSVNVSNLTLSDPDWLRGLVRVLREQPELAARLVIEITETAAMQDVSKTVRIIRTLRDMGCRVALDDFGAGYTAFSQLKDLDINFVKIDKSFVRNISQRENHMFVRTLHALAESVEIETIGEGAETLADAKLLASDGINHIQGYVYGFPTVERVWLPKGHAQRKISLAREEPPARRNDLTEEDLISLIRT